MREIVHAEVSKYQGQKFIDQTMRRVLGWPAMENEQAAEEYLLNWEPSYFTAVEEPSSGLLSFSPW